MPTQNTRMGQYAEAAKDEAKGMYDQACDRASETCRETEGMVRRNPGSSALVTFGIGFGVGLLLTHILVTPPRRRTSSWISKYRDHLPEMPSRHELADAIAKILPEALARHM